MTDQEINEAVARKLDKAFLINTPGIDLPDYCHSIEAAWEILDRYGFVISRHPGGYTCRLITNGSPASSTRDEEQSADTAPMVICKAFLKLEEK